MALYQGKSFVLLQSGCEHLTFIAIASGSSLALQPQRNGS
jgi:hypothetical protein